MEKPALAEKMLKSLGESKYGAVYIMCAIAVFKGAFRPMFTMMDKKSDPETKKYAAMREFLTEVAALPLYATLPIVLDKLATKFYADRPNKDAIKGSAKFVGLGIATLVIPAVCNLIQPPIMAAYKRSQDAKKTKVGSEINQVATVNQLVKPTFSGKVNYGMKVGG